MAQVERIEALRERVNNERLHDREQLPDVEGDRLAFLWDLEADEDESNATTVIRLGDRVIWREPALFENTDRFFEVKELLRESTAAGSRA
jgi:hypothetical protein